MLTKFCEACAPKLEPVIVMSTPPEGELLCGETSMIDGAVYETTGVCTMPLSATARSRPTPAGTAHDHEVAEGEVAGHA